MTTLETIVFAAACGASAGVLWGFVMRRWRLRRRQKQDGQARGAAFFGGVFRALTQGVYVVLGIGLIWCGYFLIIGLADAGRAEYAANAATLIVSVVTIFSIMIAYHEFIRRKKDD